MKSFPDEQGRSWVVKLFWSIYVLDRRWSFGMGRPFALQDSDIDPALPQPVGSERTVMFDPFNDLLGRTTQIRT